MNLNIAQEGLLVDFQIDNKPYQLEIRAYEMNQVVPVRCDMIGVWFDGKRREFSAPINLEPADLLRLKITAGVVYVYKNDAECASTAVLR